MFISDAYGGKCSDRYITQNSDFLDYLHPGDEVIGDRGFTVRDLLEERRLNLIIPTFTCKRCQLTNEGGHLYTPHCSCLDSCWRLKVYKILSQTVLINLVPKIDKILKICVGLVNLRAEFISSEQ